MSELLFGELHVRNLSTHPVNHGERNFASGSMMQGNSPYGGFDLQGSMRVHHHQQHPLPHHHQHNPLQGSTLLCPPIQEKLPLTAEGTRDYANKQDTFKSGSDEDDHEDVNSSKGKKASPWQRVKWTDNMVRLLITGVSYISEETDSEHGGGARKGKFAHLQKKGKWKSVSKVMAERGHFVSPQQCEDKFNDLNKRYKRLNEILGRGTSCEVVENPSLLDAMSHILEKSKEEVRKILSSKHLHYEEMCSYHNGNRLHLPPDPELQRSLHLALRCKDDQDENDMKRHAHDENYDAEQEAEYEDHDEYDENHGNLAKRAKQCESHQDFSFKNRSFNFLVENAETEPRRLSSNRTNTNMSQKKWIEERNFQIQEQRLHVQTQMLELEKERFKWEMHCRKKDRELETMKTEIEQMRYENERIALEVKQKELGIDSN